MMELEAALLVQMKSLIVFIYGRQVKGRISCRGTETKQATSFPLDPD
jgi:hypothetical protein